MNIAIYTLTRDRLDYTKVCFKELDTKAGLSYHHFVVDNGSKDGTAEWLRKEYNKKDNVDVHLLPENIGISAGSNLAVNWILSSGFDPDLIIKMDNDCLVISERILYEIRIFISNIDTGTGFAFSPRVSGINRQPGRSRTEKVNGYTVGYTGIIGGLFQITPPFLYEELGYRYDENLPKAWGQDDTLCRYLISQGMPVGYLEDLEVQHYMTTNGQAEDKPEYFERKFKEEGKRSL